MQVNREQSPTLEQTFDRGVVVNLLEHLDIQLITN